LTAPEVTAESAKHNAQRVVAAWLLAVELTVAPLVRDAVDCATEVVEQKIQKDVEAPLVELALALLLLLPDF